MRYISVSAVDDGKTTGWFDYFICICQCSNSLWYSLRVQSVNRYKFAARTVQTTTCQPCEDIKMLTCLSTVLSDSD